MWDKIGESKFLQGGVRDGVLVEGSCEFLGLVTLNSLGLIPQLEWREIVFNNLEVESLFNELGQISQKI